MQVIAMLAMLLLIQTPGAAGSGDGVIVGQLRKADGSPAANVRVGVVQAEEGSAAVEALISIAQTDNDGRYRLDQVPSGRYLLLAGPLDTPAYFPGVRSRQDAAAITVTGAGTAGPYNFKTGVIVTGRLVDETGAPLSVDPSGLALEDARGATTRARQSGDGGFDFHYVWPGRYWLTIGSTRLREITITDQDLAGLQIVAPRFHVRGRIVVPAGTSDSSGAFGSSVRLRRVGPGPAPGSVDGLVSADGAFEFRDVLPGQYVVDINLVQLRSNRSEPVLVNGNVDNFDLVIPLRLVDVTIEAGSRLPVPAILGGSTIPGPSTGGTQIVVRREEAGRVVFTSTAKVLQPPTSSSQGLYYFPFTRPAEFWMTVDDLPAGWYVKSMTDGAVDLTKAPLQVDSNPNPPRIQLTLTAIRPASAPIVFEAGGRVTNLAQGAKAESGRVMIQRMSRLDGIAGYTHEARVQSDGTFQLHGIPPGEYSLSLDMGLGTGPVTQHVVVTDRDLTTIEFSAPGALRLFALQSCLGESAFVNSCFDMQRRVVLEGVVKQFEVRNPRTLAVLTITDGKGARDVDLVGPPANPTITSGLGKAKAGERLKVFVYPRRDGGEGGLIAAFVDSDGKEVSLVGSPAR